MKLFCTDTARCLAQSHVEIPSVLLLSKAIVLHFIYLIQENHLEMAPTLVVALVDILNSFLSCCGSAIQKLELISNQKNCYCTNE